MDRSNGFQEHSIVLAPIVALGSLSSVSLAATSIATTLANFTGYSVLSGFMQYIWFGAWIHCESDDYLFFIVPLIRP